MAEALAFNDPERIAQEMQAVANVFDFVKKRPMVNPTLETLHETCGELYRILPPAVECIMRFNSGALQGSRDAGGAAALLTWMDVKNWQPTERDRYVKLTLSDGKGSVSAELYRSNRRTETPISVSINRKATTGHLVGSLLLAKNEESVSLRSGWRLTLQRERVVPSGPVSRFVDLDELPPEDNLLFQEPGGLEKLFDQELQACIYGLCKASGIDPILLPKPSS